MLAPKLYVPVVTHNTSKSLNVTDYKLSQIKDWWEFVQVFKIKKITEQSGLRIVRTTLYTRLCKPFIN